MTVYFPELKDPNLIEILINILTGDTRDPFGLTTKEQMKELKKKIQQM